MTGTCPPRHAAAALVASLGLFAATPASAEDTPRAGWRLDASALVSTGHRGTWAEQTMLAVRPAGPAPRLSGIGIHTLERPGLQEAGLVARIDQTHGASSWGISGQWSPDSAILPRAGVALEFARAPEPGAGLPIVFRGRIEARNWNHATLVSLSPGLDIYGPLGWIEAGLSAGRIGDNAVTGARLRLYRAFDDQRGLWLTLHAGQEVEAGRTFRAESVEVGRAWSLGPGSRLHTGLVWDSRALGQTESRWGIVLRVEGRPR